MSFHFYTDAPKDVIGSCNLCGSKRLALKGTVDRYGLTAPHVQCESCGLVFLSCRMTPTAYRLFYEGGHYRRLLEQFYGRPFTPLHLEAEQKIYAERLSAWLKPQPSKSITETCKSCGGETLPDVRPAGVESLRPDQREKALARELAGLQSQASTRPSSPCARRASASDGSATPSHSTPIW